MNRHQPWTERNGPVTWTAESLALHTQAVLQGAFILAQARDGAAIAAASIDHFHRYIELLIQPAIRKTKGDFMSTNNTYLAVFLGSKTSPRRAAWDAMPESDRRAKEREGMTAWKAWVENHHATIVAMGGPVGKTKRVTQRGIDDTSNDVGAFTVVRADSHEAAAKLFEKHPHFAIFPGDSVEIMPVLPIPGA